MTNQPTNSFTNEEILRQQLELLAKKSNESDIEDLPALTQAMLEIYEYLPNEKKVNWGSVGDETNKKSNSVTEFKPFLTTLEKEAFYKSQLHDHYKELKQLHKQMIELTISPIIVIDALNHLNEIWKSEHRNF